MREALEGGPRHPPAQEGDDRDDRPSHTAPVGPDLVGTQLRGTYEILRRISVGGMGVIYEAEHVRLRRRVAVKALARHLSRSQKVLDRFYQEADVVGRLRHPHIVHVFDFDVAHTGQPYLVMELLEGKNLAQRLEEGPLPVAETVRLGSQIASGLAAAHRVGVVHRDLKPENITLIEGDSGQSFAKLLDFGISKVMGATSSSLTGEHGIIGTPEYMAPEQARGDTAAVDARADQFALALIVYEMLSGRVAFYAADPCEAIRRVIESEPLPLAQVAPHVPLALRRVIERALEKSPEDRFESVSHFAQALREAEPAASQPQAASEPPAPRSGVVGPAVRKAAARKGSTGAEVRALAEQARLAFELAVDITRTSGTHAPQGRHLLETAAESLPRMAEARLGPLHRRITEVVALAKVRAESASEAFALSRIEPGMTVEEAIDAMGLPRPRALGLLARLAGRDVIQLEPAA